MGRRQLRGGGGGAAPARTPLRPLRELQRPQARRHHGRRRPVQVRRGRVRRVVARGGERGVFPAAAAAPPHALPLPGKRQGQVPRSPRVSEDQVVGVSEVSPGGRLRTFLQVRRELKANRHVNDMKTLMNQRKDGQYQSIN